MKFKSDYLSFFIKCCVFIGLKMNFVKSKNIISLNVTFGCSSTGVAKLFEGWAEKPPLKTWAHKNVSKNAWQAKLNLSKAHNRASFTLEAL